MHRAPLHFTVSSSSTSSSPVRTEHRRQCHVAKCTDPPQSALPIGPTFGPRIPPRLRISITALASSVLRYCCCDGCFLATPMLFPLPLIMYPVFTTQQRDVRTARSEKKKQLSSEPLPFTVRAFKSISSSSCGSTNSSSVLLCKARIHGFDSVWTSLFDVSALYTCASQPDR